MGCGSAATASFTTQAQAQVVFSESLVAPPGTNTVAAGPFNLVGRSAVLTMSAMNVPPNVVSYSLLQLQDLNINQTYGQQAVAFGKSWAYQFGQVASGQPSQQLGPQFLYGSPAFYPTGVFAAGGTISLVPQSDGTVKAFFSTSVLSAAQAATGQGMTEFPSSVPCNPNTTDCLTPGQSNNPPLQTMYATDSYRLVVTNVDPANNASLTGQVTLTLVPV